MAIIFLVARVQFSSSQGAKMSDRKSHTVTAHYAGSFYPKDKGALQKLINDFTGQATPIKVPSTPLRALVIPHAGYRYSGLTAAHAALTLKDCPYKSVLVMAPDHRVGLSHVAISAADIFSTPLGEIPINPLAGKLRQKYPHIFAANDISDQQEHSLEVVLPFLQSYLKDFNLVPMVIGQQDPGEIAKILATEIDNDMLLVASSDLSHFLSEEEAVSKDKDTLDSIIALDQSQLTIDDNKACGLIPILVIMDLAQEQGWQPILLHYSNSGETSGDHERVVGYGAIAFYDREENKSQDISKQERNDLLKLARNTITHALGVVKTKEVQNFQQPYLHQPSGVFITLHKKGNLRGCIGSIMPVESVLDGIRHNAINAAFHDPRFPSVTPEELAEIDIEISILTPPVPMAFSTQEELLALLEPNMGIILQQGYNQATFLPQVWQQLPDPQLFLEHLSQKAGLSKDAWRDPLIEISTYTVISFAEKEG